MKRFLSYFLTGISFSAGVILLCIEPDDVMADNFRLFIDLKLAGFLCLILSGIIWGGYCKHGNKDED